MVQAADFRRRHDAAGRGRLDWSGHRAVLREREMRTRAHLVRDVARKPLTQAEFVHHDHVIQALTSDRADEALDVSVLPR